MKCLLLYARTTPPYPAYPLANKVTASDGSTTFFIRAELIESHDLTTALQFALPAAGENFINSIPVPV